MEIDTLVYGLFTSILSSSLLGIILKYHLDRKQKKFELILEAQKEQLVKQLNTEFDAYNELMRLCHQAKLLAERWHNELGLNTKDLDKLSDIVNEFTACFFQCRILVSGESFDLVHKFKNLCQDFLVYADVASRADENAAESIVQKEAFEKIEIIRSSLISDTKMIENDLRTRLNSITGREKIE